MGPLEVARRYMDILFTGEGMEALEEILAEDFSITGPIYKIESKAEYIEALLANPPSGIGYDVIGTFEGVEAGGNGSGESGTASVFYWFKRGGDTYAYGPDVHRHRGADLGGGTRIRYGGLQ